MSAMLIRGISPIMRKQIQKLASKENQSINQMIIQFIKNELERKKRQEEIEQSRKQAFQDLRKLREEHFKQFGKLDDSTKIIRHFRDTRRA